MDTINRRAELAAKDAAELNLPPAGTLICAGKDLHLGDVPAGSPGTITYYFYDCLGHLKANVEWRDIRDKFDGRSLGAWFSPGDFQRYGLTILK